MGFDAPTADRRRTRALGVALMLVNTLFTSMAQVCLAVGVARGSTPWILLGLFLQAAMLPVLLGAYQRGDLASFFPLLSLTHVWNAIAGALWLGEVLPPARIGGTALVVAGAALLAWPKDAA